MAKVAKNLVLYGASGRLGEMLVVRQRGGQTILAAAPGESTAEPSAAQLAQRERFQQAVVYAKAQIADPETAAEYAEKATANRSAYNVAVADFFRAPDIDEVDLRDYSGAVGDTIRVRATDDFQVAQVTVEIRNADGSLVELGAAVRQPNELDWVYTATADNPSLEGDRILVRASDRPGNLAEQTQTL